MIETAIYTYWTNNGTNYNCGFLEFEHFYKIFTKSIEASSKWFKIVKVYTDKEGFEKLKNIKGVHFEILDYSVFNFQLEFWNYPKLISMYFQWLLNEPFIHIDTDLILYEKVNTDILNGDIITEKIRTHSYSGRSVLKILGSNEYFKTYIVCSGILGGNKLDVFKELFEIAAEKLKFKHYNNVRFTDLVALEEMLVTDIIEKHNCLVCSLGDHYINPEHSSLKISNKNMNISHIHYQGKQKRNKIFLNYINNETNRI